MKGVNHGIVGFAVPLAITGNVILAIISGMASVVPDTMEKISFIRIMKHRGLSHSPIFWAVIGLIGYALITSSSLPREIIITLYEAFLSGIFLHLAADALTMAGIPILPGSRLALGLFWTGSATEYLIVWPSFFAVLLFRFCPAVWHEALAEVVRIL